jgi:hypothetical protein
MADTKLLIKQERQVFRFTSGPAFPVKFLQDSIGDVETLMFVASLYHATPDEVAKLLNLCVPSDVVSALTTQAEAHSSTLQDYLVQYCWDEDNGWVFEPMFIPGAQGSTAPVHAELLPEVWKNLEITIANSIAEVADKIGDTISELPGRTGEMVFQTLATVNATRPTIGDYRAGIKHKQVKKVLVVFDVSGSMSEDTVRTIVDDVVGLAYEANASLVTVSNAAFWYPAGGFSTQQVLEDAEYMGTHYEQLLPCFQEDWDVVVTIADYDSSYGAKRVLEQAQGKIGQLLDISLVSRSTFLAECLAPLADEVRPLLIAEQDTYLM